MRTRNLECKPSRIGAAVLGIGAALALGASALADWSGWMTAAAGAGLALALLLFWRRDRAALRIALGDDGRLEVWDGSAWQAASLEGASFVRPWLTILRLEREDGLRVVRVLWPDSADPDALRALRARLRWACRIRPDTSGPDAG